MGQSDARSVCELSVDVDLTALTKDEGDEFVCALAIVARAQFLFTFDRGYVGEGLRAYGITVTDPDPWLVAAIVEEPDVFEDLLPEQARACDGVGVAAAPVLGRPAIGST